MERLERTPKRIASDDSYWTNILRAEVRDGIEVFGCSPVVVLVSKIDRVIERKIADLAQYSGFCQWHADLSDDELDRLYHELRRCAVSFRPLDNL